MPAAGPAGEETPPGLGVLPPGPKQAWRDGSLGLRAAGRPEADRPEADHSVTVPRLAPLLHSSAIHTEMPPCP